MHWLDRTVEKRAEADLVLAGARSVIVLGINYWDGHGERPWLQSGRRRSQWLRRHRPIPAGRVMLCTRITTTRKTGAERGRPDPAGGLRVGAGNETRKMLNKKCAHRL